MSREFLDYNEDQDKQHRQTRHEASVFSSFPTSVKLSFRRRGKLKREIWDNARRHGWL